VTGSLYPVVIAFPNPYYTSPPGIPAPTLPYKKADDTRSRQVWDRIGQRAAPGGGMVDLTLQPEDFYDAVGGASRLVCTKATPIISSLSLYVLRPTASDNTAIPQPFVDYRSGAAVALDQRVSRVTVLAKNAASGAFQERWHYEVRYQAEGYCWTGLLPGRSTTGVRQWRAPGLDLHLQPGASDTPVFADSRGSQGRRRARFHGRRRLPAHAEHRLGSGRRRPAGPRAQL
jgi:hypothetical protein